MGFPWYISNSHILSTGILSAGTRIGGCHSLIVISIKSVSKMTFALYFVTYSRGTYLNTGILKPYHWSFFVQKELTGTKNLGIAYQLRGMPGAFYYSGPEDVDLNKSGSLKEELQIGEVDSPKLDLVHQRLKECRIDTVESSGWNCQD